MNVDTQEFLAAAAACHALHHGPLRTAALDFARAMNAYRSDLAGLQTQLQAAELSETDASVAGKFYELADQLKTADRLSANVAAAISDFARHVKRIEEVQADVVKVAERTTPIT